MLDRPLRIASCRYYIRYVDSDGLRKMKRVRVKTKEQARAILAEAESRVIHGRAGLEEADPSERLGPVMDKWLSGLTNRNAQDDRGRFKRLVRPAFASKRMDELQEIGPVMLWLDRQRKQSRLAEAAGKNGGLSDASIRHNLNLLSRFFSWAIERGFAKVNPVRSIPMGSRPQQTQKRDTPRLRDDTLVVKLMNALPDPVRLMFCLGNRSGLRTGEIAGLRMADMEYLKDQLVRVRFSYGGRSKRTGPARAR